MSVSMTDFDPSVEPERRHSETIPEGIYRCIVIDSEMNETKAGTGKFLKLTWQVIEGEFSGSCVYSRLNLVNPNDKAVQIARQELAEIYRALGKGRISNSQELHNIPADLKVVVGKPQGETGKMYNEIKKYSPPEPGLKPVTQPQKPPESSTSSTSRPW